MTKSLRKQAYEVAHWIRDINRPDGLRISDVIPVTTQLSYGDISFSSHGCAYKQHGDERFYLVGGTPYEQLLSMVGVSDTSGLCIDFGSPYYVAGYLQLDQYKEMSADVVAQFHAFGPNLILCQSIDNWLCENREVVNLNVSYYSVIA